MNHCHLCFYLSGSPCKAFEIIKEMPPLEHFTHEFSESAAPTEKEAHNADVILVNLREADAEETLRKLLSFKAEKCELIALVQKEQFSLLQGNLTDITDIWMLPMSEEEIRFRFLRWQQTCKLSRDYREANDYFAAKECAYEQEIRQKNSTLEMIFTGLDCGVLCHTLDGSRILSVNNAALKILGYESQEELMSTGFFLIAPSVVKEDRPGLKEAIKSLKNIGDSVNVEYRVQHKNGEILHILGNIKLIEENGAPLYQRFLLDQTEQKLQEKKNEKHQMELIQALSIDYNMVCFFDLNTGMGIPLRYNEESGKRFHISEFSTMKLWELMETYIREYVYEEDREMLRQASSRERLIKELTERKLYYVNYRIVADGETEYYELKTVRAGVWETNHGIVLGFRSVDEETCKEIEQKKLLESALVQANRANKAKTSFLSNMSHDIRTPMNAIIGFTTLALAHIDKKERVEEYLKKIKMSGNHLLNLINDVLNMSQIESGKMQLAEEPCNLSNILYGVGGMIQTDVSMKRLKLYIDNENVRHEEIYCDKLRLNQILLNILSNSVKYTNTGGSITVKITEMQDAPAGYGKYQFCIRDTGIGMSEEFLPHIYEPFEREKNTTISGIQGTGLGMTITKNLVEMMSGSVQVTSKQGIGTEVTVNFMFRLNKGSGKRQTLPEPDGGPQKEPCKEDKKETPVHENSTRGARILLVEDNELNQEIAEAILQDAGFQTEIAENGQRAVDLLKGSAPGYYDLVLMDIQMPVMNGYEATCAIRNLEDKELSSVPIIAMTANAFDEDKQQALKCGMNGHIAKPIDIQNLLRSLDEILK